MITVFIMLGILFVFVVGFIQVYKIHSGVISKIDFASEYRNNFIDFSNKYLQGLDRFNQFGTFDHNLYVWLTLNVSKIQGNVGIFGVMSYMPSYQNYIINNYQIIVNTLPKFRDGNVHNFDISSVDDCLLRYMGYLEENRKETEKNVKNPIIWFREGFKEIISLPLFILSSFGIFSRHSVESIKNSIIFKFLAGFSAFITLVSSIVTIVVGYDQTLKFVKMYF